MNIVVGTYLVYVVVSVALTAWVAQVLSRNGAAFLADVMEGDAEKAASVNKLLVVAFWLINLGYVALHMRTGDDIGNLQAAVESVAFKVGGVALILGFAHLAVLFVLGRIRHGRKQEQARAQMPYRMAPMPMPMQMPMVAPQPQ